jgi:hypothetical protein
MNDHLPLHPLQEIDMADSTSTERPYGGAGLNRPHANQRNDLVRLSR